MIFTVLLALFIVLPLVELGLLLEIGRDLGTGPTIGIVVLTGLVGASLARWQGLKVLSHIRRDLEQGRMPAPRLLDGLMIIIAGALLVTPGLITDFVGFLLLVPAFRGLVKAKVRRYLEQKMRADVIDVTYWEA